MAGKEKPYRVYRGGRVKGPIERPAPVVKERGDRDGGGALRTRPRKPRRIGRRVLVVVLLLVLVAAGWAVLGYLAFRSGVEAANERLDPRAKRALAPAPGSLLSTPSNVLLLGADVGRGRDRSGTGRSDSIMLVRTDPDAHRIAYLSIPRDLRVDIPGQGSDKINAAYANGGPALAVRTVQHVTGLRVHHVALVDFATFGEVIDALGGVTVNVRRPILSNRFDCPYRTSARCERWEGWRFRKGPQEMDGHRALIFSRIRENRLDAGESDVSRGERQQQVVQALADKMTSPGTFLRLPLIGDDLVKPLATDLSAGELLQLGWIKFRTPARQTLRCRLGGTASVIGGASVIQGTEENVAVIAMVTGASAPQPPPPGSGPFGPGCYVGKRT